MNAALTAGILDCFKILQERYRCQKDLGICPLLPLTSEIPANIYDQLAILMLMTKQTKPYQCV